MTTSNKEVLDRFVVIDHLFNLRWEEIPGIKECDDLCNLISNKKAPAFKYLDMCKRGKLVRRPTWGSNVYAVYNKGSYEYVVLGTDLPDWIIYPMFIYVRDIISDDWIVL